ncbi:MAG: SAM-dependent methyltransferase [Actinoallomurus sp.]
MGEREESEVLGGIAATGLVVAAARAAEQLRPDRLFEDPFAELFVRAADVAGAGGGRESLVGERARAFLREMGDQPAVRTAFLDERLLRAAHAGCRQVVLLAAGMDTRAFRLNWPEGTRVFDVDFAEVLRLKLRVLDQAHATPRCDHRPVAADLRDDWGAALRARGFSAGRPTAWLAEGILYALPPAAADLLLDRITAQSAPGSLFAADHIERSPALDAATATMSADLVDHWQSGPAEPLESWLARYHWTPHVTDLAAATSHYGRPVPAVFDARRPGTSRGWLVTADRPR